jgi:hypothetical protein
VKQQFLLAAMLAALLLLDGRARAENVVIEHVTLIDGTRARQADMTVAVEGERIATVTPTAGTISASS